MLLLSLCLVRLLHRFAWRLTFIGPYRVVSGLAILLVVSGSPLLMTILEYCFDCKTLGHLQKDCGTQLTYALSAREKQIWKPKEKPSALPAESHKLPLLSAPIQIHRKPLAVSRTPIAAPIVALGNHNAAPHAPIVFFGKDIAGPLLPQALTSLLLLANLPTSLAINLSSPQSALTGLDTSS